MQQLKGWGSGLVVCVALLSVAGVAQADPRGDLRDKPRGNDKKLVPEIPAGGAATALTLVAGGVAIVLGRRRPRA